MLFVYGFKIINYKIKQKTLRVRQKFFLQRPPHKERAFQPAFRASLTVESAMVMPVFILVIAVIMRFFVLMDFQNVLQMRVENTVRNLLGQYENAEKIYTGYNILTGETGDMAESVGVTGGRYGMLINMDDSVENNNIKCISVSYNWQPCKIMGLNIIDMRFNQRLYYIDWNGKSIVNEESDKENDEIVYITETGKVYHTSKKCTYLTRAIQMVSVGEIDTHRNLSGGKYYKCEKCIHKNMQITGNVYFTAYGDRYHRLKDCKTLVRYIKEVKLSSVVERQKCSKCMQR